MSSCSKMMLSFVDLRFRKPLCDICSMPLLSRSQRSLLATILSMVLVRVLVNAIGRYEVGSSDCFPCLSSGITMAWRHVGGQVPDSQSACYSCQIPYYECIRREGSVKVIIMLISNSLWWFPSYRLPVKCMRVLDGFSQRDFFTCPVNGLSSVLKCKQ